MTNDEFLRAALASVEVNDSFTEAVVTMKDQSRLCFCHRVGERWARADGPEKGNDGQPILAGQILPLIALFRLNAKHLDVQLNDGSRWEAVFPRRRLP
jgi:hypothetical protein